MGAALVRTPRFLSLQKRLERARIYAREGNVLSIEFEGSKVLAKVQGSEAEPYQVSLFLNPFTEEDWNYIVETMSQKAIFSAQLLAGEMPAKIEEVFTANGLSLFPFTLGDIRSRCSCPDKANPCKHIGAVYYQLGDRFSEDPFVLFQLRGRTKEQILESLRQLRCKKSGVNLSQTVVSEPAEQKEQTKKKRKKISDQESKDLTRFWQYEEPLDSSLVAIAPPVDGKTVLNLLGRIPLAYADAQAVEQYLEQVYRTVSQQAIASALNRE